jgi:hypothetical protein
MSTETTARYEISYTSFIETDIWCIQINYCTVYSALLRIFRFAWQIADMPYKIVRTNTVFTKLPFKLHNNSPACIQYIFSADLRIILIYKISWKSVKWEPNCFVRTDRQTDRTTDRQTDMTQPTSAFRNLANELKNIRNIARINRSKGKGIPLQAWIAPKGSRKLRFTRFRDNGTGWWQGCQPYTPAAFTCSK